MRHHNYFSIFNAEKTALIGRISHSYNYWLSLNFSLCMPPWILGLKVAPELTEGNKHDCGGFHVWRPLPGISTHHSHWPDMQLASTEPEKQALILWYKVCLNMLQSTQFGSASNQEVAILFHTCAVFSQVPASGFWPVHACRINNENQLNFKLAATSYYRHNIQKKKKKKKNPPHI